MKRKIFAYIIFSVIIFAFSLTSSAADSGELSFITDEAGILSDYEEYQLEARAREIADRYSCCVYAVIVSDYRDYSSGMEQCARDIYYSYDLGYGPSGDAVILLLSMDDRDFWLMDFGSLPAEAITDYGFEALKDSFLDDFAEDDWYGGFSDYLDRSAKLFDAAERGEPIKESLSDRIFTAYGIALAAGAIIALITCLTFRSQMKTAVAAVSADEYVNPGSVNMYIRQDVYTHTTRTRRKIEQNRSSSGGGGGRSNHSGGGKF